MVFYRILHSQGREKFTETKLTCSYEHYLPVINIKTMTPSWKVFRHTYRASPVAQRQKICLQCRRHRRGWFDPCVGKIPWSRKWQPTLVFLPGKPCGWRSLVGYSPWSQRVRHNWVTEYAFIKPREFKSWWQLDFLIIFDILIILDILIFSQKFSFRD